MSLGLYNAIFMISYTRNLLTSCLLQCYVDPLKLRYVLPRCYNFLKVRDREITMSGSSSTTNPQPQRPIRVSLACIPCRAHHQRCDAAMPTCGRCQQEGKQCAYSRSRRGRPRQNKLLTSSPPTTSTESVQPTEEPISLMIELNDYGSWMEDNHRNRQIYGSNEGTDVKPQSGDQLISLYYVFFHPGHPYLLPQHALKRYLAIESEALELLYSVLQYVGSLFDTSISSEPLSLTADRVLETARIRGPASTVFDIQAALLYSIAAYWSDETGKATEWFDWVIQMALARGMNRSEFATEHGRQDPILEESLRRTWWQIYIIDAIFAGSTRTYPHHISSIEVGVQLPCDEQNYESGVSYFLCIFQTNPTICNNPSLICI